MELKDLEEKLFQHHCFLTEISSKSFKRPGMTVEEIFIVNQAEKFKKLEELLSENRICYL